MSLRTKLFLSVGAILLIVAILSYLLPEIWIRKDINTASTYVASEVATAEAKIFNTSSFLITYRLLQNIAELEGSAEMMSDLSKILSETMGNDWELGAKIIAYNPDIAFVQITNSQTVGVIPEDGKLYIPFWAPFGNEMLWVKLTKDGAPFIAVPIATLGKNQYLLFSLENKNDNALYKDKLQDARKQQALAKNASFVLFERPKISDRIEVSDGALFHSILQDEQDWIKKVDLIRLLAPFQEKFKPDGYLQTNSTLTEGVCILSKEVFTQKKEGGISKVKPSILVRDSASGMKLDIAQEFTIKGNSKESVTLGFSFSELVRNIARVLKKPLVILNQGAPLLGFTEKGEYMNLSSLKYSPTQSQYLETTYVPHILKLDQNYSLAIFIDISQMNVLTKFLDALKNKLTAKISLNLIGASLLCFLLALLLLGRISKKITEPISLLASASQEIGKGKYEGVALPKVEKRNDEISVLVHSFENMVVSLKEREKIRSVLNKVVSKEIASEILKGTIELKGEERILTILFSDIRGFTHLSEHLDPKVLIGMLNDYMTEMCRIVDETGGVVDKFVGDEIMALYGAPLHFEGHAVKAIESALQMIQTLRAWNEKQKQNKKATFEIGIGIHTGEAYAGSMGAENRLNYTVVGANVNLASRICGVAAPMQILVSEATLNTPGIKEHFQFKKQEPVLLKGIDHPVTLYEVVSK